MFQIPIVAKYHYRSMSVITSIFVYYYLNEHLETQLLSSLSAQHWPFIILLEHQISNVIQIAVHSCPRKHTTHSQLGFYYWNSLHSFPMLHIFKVYNVHELVRPCYLFSGLQLAQTSKCAQFSPIFETIIKALEK